jgi:hypothetical protein
MKTKLIPTKEKVRFSVHCQEHATQEKYSAMFKEANSSSSLNLKWKGLGRTPNKVFELSSLDYLQVPRIGKRPSYLVSSRQAFPQCGEEAWLIRYLRKLTEFRRLSQNWNSHDAEPPNGDAINHARRILSILVQMNFPPSHVTPSAENGVGISFVRGNKYADIECFNTGETLAVTSTGQGNPTVWEVENNSEAIRSALRRIRDFIRG